MYLPTRKHRVLIMGREGAVGANQPLATQAGLDTLRAGGNAVDASVAISLTLGVVEPGMSGLGGDGFYHVYTAQDATSRCYNATGAAPLAATPERFRAGGMAVRGPLSVSTPGLLGGLGAMHAAPGRLPWRHLCGPAIEHAREGFAVSHHYGNFASEARAVPGADARSRAVFLAGLDIGVPPLAALICQPDLARTLEEIAQDGAEPSIAADCEALPPACARPACWSTNATWTRTSRRPGSDRHHLSRLSRHADAAEFNRLHHVADAENRRTLDLAKLDPARRIHVLVEAKQRAFLDRERYGTDPRFGDVPLDRLLSDAYADECAASIDMARPAISRWRNPSRRPATRRISASSTRKVTPVSGIQSLNSGWLRREPPATPILLNNRMAYWHLAAGHATGWRRVSACDTR